MFGGPRNFRSPSDSRGFRSYPNIRSLTLMLQIYKQSLEETHDGHTTNALLSTLLSCHVMSRHVTSRHGTFCQVMSRHVTSFHVKPRHVTSFHVISRHAKPCHVMSCHIMSRHDKSCHVLSRPVTSCHVGCPEGCRFHTASAVYHLVILFMTILIGLLYL